ncbi:RNA ligase, T4 RnlA family [Meiothermus luteus]|uniref:RNA ligase, T4 RnlA family n=1 Tax=Meiothermus luteus TaxID=2026184 RepID=A0A399EKB3_9DEIN|nr:RNA ligase [Meiothermus luteus]RIH82822.1 RNA ligase, T4 RnlA family [Meiothermus luteus]
MLLGPPPPLDLALEKAQTPPFLVRRDGGLVLVSYRERGAGTQPSWDPVTRELRGIIYREATGEVVSRPFHRFFNLGDPRCGVDPSRSLGPGDYIGPKEDGRLLQAFFLEGALRFATRGSLRLSPEDERALRRSWTLDHEALAVRAREVLGPVTLLFEVLDPERPIMVRPEAPKAVLLAVRHIPTGRYWLPGVSQELREVLGGLRVPHVVWEPAGSASLQEVHQSILEREGVEGFVVWLAQGDFVKLKTRWALGFTGERGDLERFLEAFRIAFYEERLDDLQAGIGEGPYRQVFSFLMSRLEDLVREAVAQAEAVRGLPRREAYEGLRRVLGAKPQGLLLLNVALRAYDRGEGEAWEALKREMKRAGRGILKDLLAESGFNVGGIPVRGWSAFLEE